MQMVRRIAAYLWVFPYTIVGIAIGLLLMGRFRLVDGVIEIHGVWVAAVLDRLPVAAMALTFGHVVFGQTEKALNVTREHERVHVRQYERWGIMFGPAYLAASALLYLRGKDAYRDNPFEVEAYAIESPRWD